MEDNNKNTEKDLKALEELRDLGVLTQDEFDAKVAQMNPPQKTTVPDEAKAVKSIDYDELKKLENLLNEGLINEEDYEKKATSMLGFRGNHASEPTGNGLSGWIKRNVIATVMIAILAVGVAVTGTLLATQYSNVEALQKSLRAKNATIAGLEDTKDRLLGYKAVVDYFYLDSAVLTTENDRYYHRYNCPTLPDQYTYWLYNVEAAEDHGYSKCPDCFKYSKEDYYDYYLK